MQTLAPPAKMKPLFHILTLSLLIGCSNPEDEPTNNLGQEIGLALLDTSSLDGLWVLPDYLDSVLTYKTISKYRTQAPAFFAILIDIDKDTLKSYGSIYDIKTAFKPEGDTIHVFEKTATGQWTLSFNRDTENLELRHTEKSTDGIDPKVYVLEKRPDLRFLLDTLDQGHKTRTSITNYFHDRIFAGTYENLETGDQVTFEANGQLRGFKNFHKYKVDVYYGTYHPLHNLDNIRFYRDSSEVKKDFASEGFSWQFNGDTLILNKINCKIYRHNGQKVRGEEWTLDEQKIKLIKN